MQGVFANLLASGTDGAQCEALVVLRRPGGRPSSEGGLDVIAAFRLQRQCLRVTWLQ